MGTIGRKLGGKDGQYTRIDIFKPDKIDDGYSEIGNNTYTKRLASVPAYFSHPQDNQEEDLVGSLVRSRTVAEVEVRYSFGKDVKPTWKIKDLFEGVEYEVISSGIVLDRRRWVRFKVASIE